MKKSLVLILLIAIIAMVLSLTACSGATSIEDMKIEKEKITFFEMSVESSTKITERSEKIVAAFNELEKVKLEKFKEKIPANVFDDSIIAKINFKVEDFEGSYQMTFAEVAVGGEKVCLVKCDALNGFKTSKMPKGIYQMKSLNEANVLFIKIFNNIL